MPALFSNNASATLTSNITSSATSITVTSGQGALFPAITSGGFYYATLVNSSNQLEIVKVTARATDVFTVVRIILTGNHCQLKVFMFFLESK